MPNNGHTGELIPVEPLQRAVLEVVAQGTSWAELATRMGWTFERRRGTCQTVGDGTRLKRALGLAPNPPRPHLQPYFNRRIGIRLCEQIAEAAQLDPVEVGC